jgi:hypothetical protein
MHKSHSGPALLAMLVAIIPSIGGCDNDKNIVGDNHIAGSGRIVSKVRNVGSYEGIHVRNFADVIIAQDSVESLRVEADDNIIDVLRTSVSDGTLFVELPDGSYDNITVRIYASMKTISLLESSGAADFQTSGPIYTDAIICRITGAGTIRLAGTATHQIVEIVGAGSIHNFDLVSSYCTAWIAGSGAIEVNVTQQLDAVIVGAGSITYMGNPSVVHQTISGLGSIRGQN